MFMKYVICMYYISVLGKLSEALLWPRKPWRTKKGLVVGKFSSNISGATWDVSFQFLLLATAATSTDKIGTNQHTTLILVSSFPDHK